MGRKKVYGLSVCCIVSMIFFYASCFSQNTNDPYSIYGVGKIDDKIYNRTSGMAGTGLALRSSNFLINNNPAAIAGLTRSYFVFNAEGVGKTVQFSGTPIDAGNSTSKDFWVKGISLSVKINGFWASSFGFDQFSNINYKFNGSKQIEGSLSQYLNSYEGDGGLNDYYWTNAFSVGKHLMIGVKSSFIAGSINRKEIITDDALSTNIQSTQQDYLYHLRFEYGGIYHTLINKDWDFSLGGKFSAKTSIAADRTLTVIQNGVNVVNNDYINTNQYYLPVSEGAGVALAHYNPNNKKSTFAFDYIFDNWSSVGMHGNGWQLVNSNKISAGYELTKLMNVNKQKFETSSLQFGAYFNSGDLNIRNTPIRNYGITMGYAGILRELQYSLSLDGGIFGSKQNDLIKESYFQLTIGLSYRSFLFSKGRKYD